MGQKRITRAIMPAALVLLACASCARIGTPTGGPRDEEPPVFVRSVPAPGSTGVDRHKVEIWFDELVNVKDAFSKVVVSPAIGSAPRVTSAGRRVTVEFDTLAPNTTYTIDFADAIEDNNESNPLQGFTYSFSTGETIDSLRISGRVLSARGMEPAQSMLVGVHPADSMTDTTFQKTRLLRMAKTDDRGQFTIRGLSPGRYRVFAVTDNDNDYAYSSPEEDLAFLDMVVEPRTQGAEAVDSVYDPFTGKLDTVVSRSRTQYLPNDLLLRSFNSELRQQYMSKYERIDSTRVYLKFNTRSDSLLGVQVVGMPEGTPLGVLERSERLDSLVWWLTPELVHNDSLQLAVSYTRSNMQLEPEAVTDTLNFFFKRQAPKKENEKKGREEKNSKGKKGASKGVSVNDSLAAITTRFNAVSKPSQDVHLPVYFESPAPLARFDSTAVRLSVLVDTLWQPVDGAFRLSRAEEGNPRRLSLDYPWDYGTKYRVEIDTLAGEDIYGLPTRPFSHEFTVKDTGDYCSLLYVLSGIPAGMPAFVELLNGSDALVRSAEVKDGEAYFPFLEPGRYYARVVFDANGNGEYDTGNYALGLQPEVAYYYPKAVNMKKNWDKEERWDIFAVAVDQMKPAAILKNKPATDKRAKNRKGSSRKEEEEEEEDYFDPTVNPFAK